MIHMARDVSDTLQSYASVREFRDTLVNTYPLGDEATLDRMASTGLVERIDGRFEPRLDPGILNPSTDPEDWTSLEQKLWSALRKIRCKTLVVRGGVSAMLAEKAAWEMVDGALRDAALATVPNAGHAVMVDDRSSLLGVLEEFLAASR
jgi:pimeloyl-ACP methyl ester carboxylesterase